jgi:choline dehydrogenase
MVDYVVVGAGAAGCVLAGRLSEDEHASVALLEAGGSDRALFVRLPAGFAKLFKTDRDWAYFTEPELGLAGRRLFWPRGKMLGGSSSMNAMVYIRGTPGDYDRWEQLGCEGWSFGDVLPLFRRTERNARGASPLHGGDGPLHVNDLVLVNEVSRAFLDACAERGLPRNDDFNGERQEGYGRYQVTQRRGRRFSAADAYLAPARRRRNLRVETYALATRLVFEGTRCTGVEYVKAGKTHRVYASREVILAAGAINSPQLLLASGIGPADELEKLGVPVVTDSPGVGKNLQDHVAVAASWACTRPVTLDMAEGLPNLLRFLIAGTGPLTSNIAEVGAFLKTDPTRSDPDIQLVFAPAWYVDHGLEKPQGCGFSIAAALLRPEARGEITLRCADPREPPRITARYLSSQRDRRILLEGVKRIREIAAATALASYRGSERAPGEDVKTDGDLARWLERSAETLYHPVGTCKMGTAADAVVDPRLRVRGIERLRIADASIMPIIPGGNTHAPTLMIAEKAVAMIREARSA